MQLKPIIPYLIIVFVSIIHTSCISTANFETGKTLGRDNSKVSIALNYQTSEPKTSSNGIYDPNDGGSVNIGYTYGLIDRLDIGIVACTNANFILKTKFMLTKPMDKFAFSVGASTNIFTYISFTSLYHSNLTLFTSYDINDVVTIYANPHLVYFPKNTNLNKENYEFAACVNFGALFQLFHKNNRSLSIGIEYTNFAAMVYKQQTISFGLVYTGL
ncbi:MAG: hypothetical protein B6I18_04575 [Bacteroidetes bacterium 4572_112]|nr:MAG: hypothetical protein B6I18_04575 [Bacteroidetes bacterium 4572_112]